MTPIGLTMEYSGRRRMSPEATDTVYQIKVALMNVRPPIWRRLLVPSSVTLERLHKILQVSLGWTDTHLHQFVAGALDYGVPDPEFDFDGRMLDEHGVPLSQLLKKEKERIRYDYDFGDGWRHEILLEKVFPFDPNIALPTCMKGRRACPPEDVGGTWGYQKFLKAIGDPSHPEHDEYVEWIGGTFDPEDFNLDEVNELLSGCVR
jgi:hypothetical protein